MFLLKLVDKLKTHVLCSVTFHECHTVYEKMRKNMIETERQQMAHALCMLDT